VQVLSLMKESLDYLTTAHRIKQSLGHGSPNVRVWHMKHKRAERQGAPADREMQGGQDCLRFFQVVPSTTEDVLIREYTIRM
jgi:hypothetical protein